MYFCKPVEEARLHRGVRLNKLGHLPFRLRRIVKLNRSNQAT
jgi:hypothetical protein